MNDTDIEWTDKTWNPTRGCSRVSPGCRECFAEKIAARFSDEGQPFHLFAERTPKPHWTGKVGLIEDKLMEPLRWRKPSRVFVNSMSDLFHEDLPNEVIDLVFAVMAMCRQHTLQLLTKRADRLLEYLSGEAEQRIAELVMLYQYTRDFNSDYEFDARDAHLETWPLPNVHIGVSDAPVIRTVERIDIPSTKHFTI